MSQPLGGAGLGLPLPTYLYPTQINNAAADIGNAYLSLAPGDAFTIPPGVWFLNRTYSFIQYFDSVNAGWRGFSTARNAMERVKSDGVNVRIANLTGCPVAAVVVAGGSGYVQSSTTVTANTGGSTWQAIVGGMLSVTTIANAGSGYGVAPELLIQQPPAPGVQATGYCVLTGGSVTGVTLTNVGAGYITAPTAVIIPSQYDPNLASTTGIVPATVTLVTVGAGSIAAVICTNNGAPASPTLTVSGTGTAASVVAVICNTLSSGSVVAGGAGFTGGGGLVTVGGVPSAVPQYVNPAIQLTGAIPRPAQAGFFATGGSLVSIATIYDSGLFFGTPIAVVMPGAGNLQTTTASVTLVLGSTPDTVLLQPAP